MVLMVNTPEAKMNLLALRIGRGNTLRWIIYFTLFVFAAYRLIFMPNLLNAASYNGFDLSNSEIPRRKIEHGGPPRDGIPSIDKPRFMSSLAADSFLHADDWIIGLEINGQARAYPVKILNLHEIVNDHFGEQGVLISYCPLCRTAMAFRSIVDGQELSFGVSGLLHNSDVLMYDRQTESLWSQILGRAISGPNRGIELQSIPVIHTTWLDWVRQYPDSQVLSPNTGYARDYSRDPYASYADSGRIWFSVANRDKRYFNKEFVIGLKDGEVTRAWPFSELNSLWESDPDKVYVQDSINGKTVRIYYKPASRSAHITDDEGQLLNGIAAYWFAWMAFYPDSEVFTVP